MTELKHWTEQGAPPTIECLLKAAQSEQPSEASLVRALAGLGVAAGVSSSTAGAAAAGSAATIAATASSKGSTVGLVGLFGKWIAIGVAVGSAGIGLHLMAGEQTRPAHPQPSAQASSIAATARGWRALDNPGQPPLAGVSAGSAVPPEAATGTASTPVPGSVGTGVRRASGDVGVGADTAIPAETLSREIAIIDRARGLLTAGRAAEVMAVLDDYEHRFSQRHFAPEAHYLRLEALLLAGRAAEARALAQRLLASYPTSPQSEKARQLLAR